MKRFTILLFFVCVLMMFSGIVTAQSLEPTPIPIDDPSQVDFSGVWTYTTTPPERRRYVSPGGARVRGALHRGGG